MGKFSYVWAARGPPFDSAQTVLKIFWAACLEIQAEGALRDSNGEGGGESNPRPKAPESETPDDKE